MYSPGGRDASEAAVEAAEALDEVAERLEQAVLLLAAEQKARLDAEEQTAELREQLEQHRCPHCSRAQQRAEEAEAEAKRLRSKMLKLDRHYKREQADSQRALVAAEGYAADLAARITGEGELESELQRRASEIARLEALLLRYKENETQENPTMDPVSCALAAFAGAALGQMVADDGGGGEVTKVVVQDPPPRWVCSPAPFVEAPLSSPRRMQPPPPPPPFGVQSPLPPPPIPPFPVVEDPAVLRPRSPQPSYPSLSSRQPLSSPRRSGSRGVSHLSPLPPDHAMPVSQGRSTSAGLPPIPPPPPQTQAVPQPTGEVRRGAAVSPRRTREL
eukprot:Hpha_TRINITY_DN10954_c0_g1::TRINITY_DN10954_c0_g1_i1::g.26941::m.26941